MTFLEEQMQRAWLEQEGKLCKIKQWGRIEILGFEEYAVAMEQKSEQK